MINTYLKIIESYFPDIYYTLNKSQDKITLKLEHNEKQLLNNEKLIHLVEQLPKEVIIEILYNPKNEPSRFPLIMNYYFDKSKFKIDKYCADMEESQEKISEKIEITWYKKSVRGGCLKGSLFTTTITYHDYGYINKP